MLTEHVSPFLDVPCFLTGTRAMRAFVETHSFRKENSALVEIILMAIAICMVPSHSRCGSSVIDSKFPILTSLKTDSRQGANELLRLDLTGVVRHRCTSGIARKHHTLDATDQLERTAHRSRGTDSRSAY